MRREEAANAPETAAIDRQAHDMPAFFKAYPMYQHIAELMEQAWNDGNIMEFYQ